MSPTLIDYLWIWQTPPLACMQIPTPAMRNMALTICHPFHCSIPVHVYSDFRIVNLYLPGKPLNQSTVFVCNSFCLQLQTPFASKVIWVSTFYYSFSEVVLYTCNRESCHILHFILGSPSLLTIFFSFVSIRSCFVYCNSMGFDKCIVTYTYGIMSYRIVSVL